MKKYDYVLVGSGLYAGVWAYEAKKRGKTCLVVEKRDHIGGNVYCEEVEGIHVHRYGAHIFHTSDRQVWDYVNQLAEFNRYTNSPVANYKGEMYNMPFNMNTFSKMWGISTPAEAKAIIEEQKKAVTGEPKNLEEQAISLVGTDIYQKLVKATPRNSGDGTAKSFRPSLSADSRCVLRMTTTISMIYTRVFRLAATT